MQNILEAFGFECRIKGDHFIYTCNGIPKIKRPSDLRITPRCKHMGPGPYGRYTRYLGPIPQK